MIENGELRDRQVLGLSQCNERSAVRSMFTSTLRIDLLLLVSIDLPGLERLNGYTSFPFSNLCREMGTQG